MSLFRAYIAPLTEAGTAFLDWIEVTSDVDFESMGAVEQKLDNSDFDVGLSTFSDFSFSLRNEHGLYSIESVGKSIFPGHRSGSLFKLTWQKQDFPSKAGMVKCGQFIAYNTEVTVFEGIISDDATQMQILDQKVGLTVLGKESVLSGELTPYGSLSNGMTFANMIYACLNQSGITQYFTVTLGNINPSLNSTIDDIASFENQTVKESLDLVLAASNSILYVNAGVIYVKARTPSATVLFHFYGQGSNAGIENIIDLRNIMRGINRTFNFWTWASTTLTSQDATSISDNGILKKEISFDFITNTTRRQAILDSLKDEFKLPKQEFVLSTPLNHASLALFLLDKIDIDYPNVYYTEENQNVPIYGVAKYGVDRYPYGEYSVVITTSDNFKIIGRKINTKNQTIEFKMRKI